jgi:hypothetical protein
MSGEHIAHIERIERIQDGLRCNDCHSAVVEKNRTSSRSPCEREPAQRAWAEHRTLDSVARQEGGRRPRVLARMPALTISSSRSTLS